MIENLLWLLVVGGGPLLLVILFAYALLRRRRMSGAEQHVRDRATKRMYEEEPKS